MNIVLQIVLAAIAPTLVALVAGWLAIKANKVNAAATAKVEEAKVDAAAYDRARGFYESMLEVSDKRLDQVEKRCQQLERQVDQVQREKDQLELHVDRIQQEKDQLKREVAALRARLIEAGLEP